MGKGIVDPWSKCEVGLPTDGGGGGGNVNALRVWCDGTNKPGLKWNDPFEIDDSLSDDCVI